MRGHLGRALDRLAAALGPLRVASLYRTAPVSAILQPDYLNTAAIGETALPPCDLLRLAKQLEREAGRVEGGPRDAPRPLDVDLLVYGEVCGLVDCGEGLRLELPHPRLAERAFVLVPLAEVAPGMRVPPEGRTVAELLGGLGEVEGVERVR